MSWFKLHIFWIKVADIKTKYCQSYLFTLVFQTKTKISRDFSKVQQSLFSFWQNFDDTRVELWVFEGCVRAFADAVFLLHMQGCH